MRLKTAPGDFRVDEVLEYESDPRGRFYVHRLEKRKVDTPTAIAMVAREAEVDRGAIAYAGLKDRQGVTSQWISIEGRQLDFETEGVRLQCVGRTDRPIDSKMSTGNRFSIAIRDLDDHELEVFDHNLRLVERFGFANYFDDQRFGCLRHGQGFVLGDILAGRYDHALYNLVARPSPVAEQGGDVKLKRSLAKVWGDWEACGRIARGPVWRRLFEHLQMHPDDFRTAIEMLPVRTRLIHAFAFQSMIWNRAVDRWVKGFVPYGKRKPIETLDRRVHSWQGLDESGAARLRDAETPLFGLRNPDDDVPELAGDPEFEDATEAVLDEIGLSPAAFEMHRVQGMILRQELRRVRLYPGDLQLRGPERDEMHRGRRKIWMRFALPRGAYATMLIKHLFSDAEGDRRRNRPRRRPG